MTFDPMIPPYLKVPYLKHTIRHFDRWNSQISFQRCIERLRILNYDFSHCIAKWLLYPCCDVKLRLQNTEIGSLQQHMRSYFDRHTLLESGHRFRIQRHTSGAFFFVIFALLTDECSALAFLKFRFTKSGVSCTSTSKRHSQATSITFYF